MPTPARTSLESIVASGRRIIESTGLDGLTLNAVATTEGVKTPSLYKHIASRADLVRLIAEDVIDDLGSALDSVPRGDDARMDVVKLLNAFRGFAMENPGGYGLIFGALPEEMRPETDRLLQSSAAVLHAAGALAGEDLQLEAARTLTAWAHGFVSMELAGAFRLGGNIDQAFSFGAERLAEALSGRADTRAGIARA